MPSKKKKYNARFPAGRIKKIMQSDEEIGKVAQAVPIIIYLRFKNIPRTLELFVESLLAKTVKITNSRNAKTLSTSHMKQCIMSEQRFDFLRELVKNIPDISVAEEAANYNEDDAQSSPEEAYPDSDTPYDLSMPSTSTRATRNGAGSANSGQQYRRGTGGGMNSVIKHTNQSGSVGDNRFTRSDSTPAVSGIMGGSVIHAARQRLKHQSQSLPVHHNNNTAIGSGSYSYNTLTDGTPPKRSRLECTAKIPADKHLLPAQTLHPQPPQHTVIPAPIVSFDFCNKPIVKIDYSNLPLQATSLIAAPSAVNTPHSAPANIAVNTQSPFTFNAVEPVINIDLSNIVTASGPIASNGAAAASTPTTDGMAALATISIAAPLLSNALSSQPRNSSSKASQATPFITKSSNNNNNNNLPTPMIGKCLTSAKSPKHATSLQGTITPTAAAANKNSFFELDEDYDNI